MKILDIEQNTPEWDAARLGKVTGSKLKDIVSERGGRKIGFYQLNADRLALADEIDEDARDRGHRLEHEAIELFEGETGKKVNKDIGLVISDFHPSIAVSPDGLIQNDGIYDEAVEVKCLGTARHIQIIEEDVIPRDYWYQVLQYFIVCDTVAILNFVSYDPRLVAHPFHLIVVTREDVKEQVERYKQYQLDTLAEIDAIVEKLAF